MHVIVTAEALTKRCSVTARHQADRVAGWKVVEAIAGLAAVLTAEAAEGAAWRWLTVHPVAGESARGC